MDVLTMDILEYRGLCTFWWLRASCSVIDILYSASIIFLITASTIEHNINNFDYLREFLELEISTAVNLETVEGRFVEVGESGYNDEGEVD